jgi:hypothetical protein
MYGPDILYCTVHGFAVLFIIIRIRVFQIKFLKMAFEGAGKVAGLEIWRIEVIFFIFIVKLLLYSNIFKQYCRQ